MFFWGAGNVCRHFLQHLKKELPLEGIVDSKESLLDTRIEGVPVYHGKKTETGRKGMQIRHGVEERVILPEDTVFVITTYVYYVSVKKQLEDWGFQTMFIYELCDYAEMDWSSLCRMHYAAPEEKDLPKIKAARSLLADAKSKEIFDALLERRQKKIYDCTDIRSKYPQYLEMDLVPFSEAEVIVDCGAFLGDGLRLFKEHLTAWKMFHCFEPDQDNFRILQETCKKYENTKVHHAAVGDYNGTAYFSEGANAGGELQQGNETGQRIEVRMLDSLDLSGVTYITADIEGTEMAMLRGAQRTIERYCPKLALCVYHKAGDLWEIPHWLKEVNPRYKVYLRHYGETAVDTVAYALPS